MTASAASAALGVAREPSAGSAAGPPAPPVVSLDRVSRRFGAHQALTDVSLSVGRGEIHALLGPNGAGKTTLLRVMAGLMDPSAGEVRILGHDHRTHGRALRQQIGLVPSGSRSFYLRISAFENLVFFGRMYGLSRREAARRSEEVLADVGLTEKRNARVQTMSTGMQRRLATARALLAEPAVILIDEATHDLDPRAASQVRMLVREVVDGRGASVIWATQRVEEIRGFADQVTVLDKGHVRFSGPVVGFLSHAEAGRFVVRLLLSSPEPTRAAVAECLEGVAEVVPAGDGAGQFLVAPAEGRFLGEALDRLGRAGFTVVSCTEERPGAEQAFLHLTSAR